MQSALSPAHMLSVGAFAAANATQATFGLLWRSALDTLNNPFVAAQLSAASSDPAIISAFVNLTDISLKAAAKDREVLVRDHAKFKSLSKDAPTAASAKGVVAKDLKTEIARAVKKYTATGNRVAQGMPAHKASIASIRDPEVPDCGGEILSMDAPAEQTVLSRDAQQTGVIELKGCDLSNLVTVSMGVVSGERVDGRSLKVRLMPKSDEPKFPKRPILAAIAALVLLSGCVKKSGTKPRDVQKRTEKDRVRMAKADVAASRRDEKKTIETPRFGFPAEMRMPGQRQGAARASRVSRVRGQPTIRPRGFKANGVFSAQPRASEPVQTMVIEKRAGGMTVRVHYVEHQGRMHFAGYEEVQSPLQKSADNAARALMTPLEMRDDRLRAFGFGKPGGESAPDLSGEYEQTPVDERLATMLIFQLRQDPKTLADDRIRTAFNAHLMAAGHHDVLSRAQWDHFLKRTMTAAVRHTPLMQAGGLSSIADIQKAASHVLGMSPARFAEWQEHFGVESISEHLFAGMVGAMQAVELSGLGEQLLKSVEQHVAMRAKHVIDIGEMHFAVPRSEEIDLQWSAARLSIVPDAKRKVNEAAGLIGAVAKRNVHGAARLLAMVVKQSELNEETPNEHSLAPRWTAGDVAALVNALVKSDAAAVVSHRSFRQYLEPRQNRSINVAIHEAHYVSAIDEVAKVDVMEVSDEAFWAMVDATGAEETIMDTVLDRMMKHDIQIPLDDE